MLLGQIAPRPADVQWPIIAIVGERGRVTEYEDALGPRGAPARGCTARPAIAPSLCDLNRLPGHGSAEWFRDRGQRVLLMRIRHRLLARNAERVWRGASRRRLAHARRVSGSGARRSTGPFFSRNPRWGPARPRIARPLSTRPRSPRPPAGRDAVDRSGSPRVRANACHLPGAGWARTCPVPGKPTTSVLHGGTASCDPGPHQAWRSRSDVDHSPTRTPGMVARSHRPVTKSPGRPNARRVLTWSSALTRREFDQRGSDVDSVTLPHEDAPATPRIGLSSASLLSRRGSRRPTSLIHTQP